MSRRVKTTLPRTPGAAGQASTRADSPFASFRSAGARLSLKSRSSISLVPSGPMTTGPDSAARNGPDPPAAKARDGRRKRTPTTRRLDRTPTSGRRLPLSSRIGPVPVLRSSRPVPVVDQSSRTTKPSLSRTVKHPCRSETGKESLALGRGRLQDLAFSFGRRMVVTNGSARPRALPLPSAKIDPTIY